MVANGADPIAVRFNGQSKTVELHERCRVGDADCDIDLDAGVGIWLTLRYADGWRARLHPGVEASLNGDNWETHLALSPEREQTLSLRRDGQTRQLLVGSTREASAPSNHSSEPTGSACDPRPHALGVPLSDWRTAGAAGGPADLQLGGPGVQPVHLWYRAGEDETLHLRADGEVTLDGRPVGLAKLHQGDSIVVGGQTLTVVGGELQLTNAARATPCGGTQTPTKRLQSVRLVIDVDSVQDEVRLIQYADSATLADLLESATGAVIGAGDLLWVDDHRHAGGDPLRSVGFVDGSRISRERLERPGPLKGWSITVSGGLDAGRSFVIPADRRISIGRSPAADITIDSPSTSNMQAEFEIEGDGVRVRDLGSMNDTLVDGKAIGATEHRPGPAPATRRRRPAIKGGWGRKEPQVEVVPSDSTLADNGAIVAFGGTAVTLLRDPSEDLAPSPGSLHNLSDTGTAPFNRPPRPPIRKESDPIGLPTRKPPGTPARFNVATVAAPLLAALVMILVMKSVQYAAIGILSPVLAAWNYVEQKRRFRQDTKDEEKRFSDAVDEFSVEIERAATNERARRREQNPDPATVIRRAGLPTTRLWERRPAAEDYLRLHGGVGDVPWSPELDGRVSGRPDPKIREVLDATRLRSAPVEVDLNKAGVVGIVGDRQGALAVARSLLCQAAVHCGPADLTIGVFCDPGREESWSWTAWLPHTRILGDATGAQWLSADRRQSESLLRSMWNDGDVRLGTPTGLILIDSDILTEGREAPGRRLLGHGRPTGVPSGGAPRVPVSGIVVAPTVEALPATANTVILVGEDACGVVRQYDEHTTLDDVVLAGVSVATARRCALDLARFDDPELVVPGVSLPGMVRLTPLLGLQDVTAEAIARTWSSSSRVDTPIGVGASGLFTFDVVRDGPHGLVGGTTGSGKSEFLRSLVAGLAARNDPTRLSFILIDFKGGKAFEKFQGLPHTVGTVSNLDEQLADRALRALEAELAYRQKVFADAGQGIDTLEAYWATSPPEPLPRLLVVVDEFAMLAKDYPDVLSSLVSVAVVGRTLGVHMILATQRPAGVVNEDILANTNLRVALRVQSKEDSSNVIGVPDASAISRIQKGRAYVKLGQDDITPVQTALVTGAVETADTILVDVAPLVFGGGPPRPSAPSTTRDDAETDLDVLVRAIIAASTELGYAAPRPVWPEPLGERIGLRAVAEPDTSGPVVGAVRGSWVHFALCDDPDRQTRFPTGWDMRAGNLLLVGIPGSGTTTTLASIALTLAAERSPEDLDLLILDLGTRDLSPLTQLPHTVAYVGSGSDAREQQVRLLKYLARELDRRRLAPDGHRQLLVLIDGLAPLKDEYGEDGEGQRLLAGLYAAYTDGPDVGMHFAVSTSRAKAVPPPIDEVTTQKWFFRLAEAYDYVSAGISRKQIPHPVPGRCVPADTKLQTHVASSALPLAEAVAGVASNWDGAQRKQTVVGKLPESITLAELGVSAQVDRRPWRIPIGIRESDLQPAFLDVYEDEHVLIAGPARSGKSTLLLTVAESIRSAALAAGRDADVWGVCGRRSPLSNSTLERIAIGQHDLAGLLAQVRVRKGPLALLIDDAEQFDDSDNAIKNLLSARIPDLLVVASGRADDLRSHYGHWTKQIRKSRLGVLLQPNIDYDGELLLGPLPRRAPVALTPGRGYLTSDGHYELLQCVSPGD